MSILQRLGKELLFFDGGMGTMLQKNGLSGGEIPDLLNITNPELIKKIHREYAKAGADFITTNTFGSLEIKSDGWQYHYGDVIRAAVENAKSVAAEFSDRKIYVAFDLGPTGKLLEPLGDMSFDAAYSQYAEAVKIGAAAGADCVIIETMSDTLEAKAAVLAAKENCTLPVFCTMTFDATNKTLTGGDVRVMASILEGLHADCIGINCGFGPDKIAPLIRDLQAVASVPVMAQPNAGLPAVVDGKTVYNVNPDKFREQIEDIAIAGASIIGGCCGTTPEHIRALADLKQRYKPRITEKDFTLVTSYSKAVFLDNRPVIIGERINPTGKKKFKEALKTGNISYIVNEAVKQDEAGAHILDVNVGLPEIDEAEMMERVVKEVSGTVNLPLQIDSSEPPVLERAMRIYNGKPMINSVNGKRESMDAVFPLVQKYGGVVVGLALDEDGIPPTAEGRLEIARKIVNTAAKYGIKKKDIVIDALTLTVSAQQKESGETIKALKMIKDELGVKTVLGVSNISFGLPRRELVNSTFFALALNSGLDACIINPCTESMMDTYRAYRALAGIDSNCADYLDSYTGTVSRTVVTASDKASVAGSDFDAGFDEGNALYHMIVKGLKNQSYAGAEAALKIKPPLDIINGILVPALDYVGNAFEKGTMFLPQLMMSAETVQSAFAAIKAEIEKSGEKSESKGKILVATVKGDIHDIGKNIVRVLLENYGYDVTDLGKDVPPELIVETLKKEDIHLCGLSALMTTTVVSMENTIKAIREAGLDVKVWVGGAVLNQDYADMIGADAYCKDALASVNYAGSILGH